MLKKILDFIKIGYDVSTCRNCKYHGIAFDKCPDCGSTDVYTSGR